MKFAMFVCAIFSGVAAAADDLPPDALSGWTIVVAADAISSERYAAEEFKALFLQATGKELPVSNDVTIKKRVILIGPGASGLANTALGDEGLEIRIEKKRILISGGRPRGTLYGVYEFFERYMGCEFLTFDQTKAVLSSPLKKTPCACLKPGKTSTHSESRCRTGRRKVEYRSRLVCVYNAD